MKNTCKPAVLLVIVCLSCKDESRIDSKSTQHDPREARSIMETMSTEQQKLVLKAARAALDERGVSIVNYHTAVVEYDDRWQVSFWEGTPNVAGGPGFAVTLRKPGLEVVMVERFQ